MEWSDEAEKAIRKVPFFVRRKVRARVEEEAAREGKRRVALADVGATRKRFLSGMDAEVRGYRVEGCFGSGGCPNRAVDAERLLERIEAFMAGQDLRGFLERHVKGGLRFHHEFRITLADCPNACSQPQIRDIGIIGAVFPTVTATPCSDCGACRDACREEAVTPGGGERPPAVDERRCLACGRCIAVCPTGTLARGRRGYRVQLGGRLGRHPMLARELPGLYDADGVMRIVESCVAFYKANSTEGRRFAAIFEESDFRALAAELREGNPEGQGSSGGGR